MKKRLMKILLILVIAIFSMQLKAYAAIIVSTDKEVKSDSGSVTVSVTSKQTLGSFKITLVDNAGLILENTSKGSSSFELSGDKLTITGSSSDGITNLGSYTFKVPTVTTNSTYNVKFKITSMATTDLEDIADETNTAVIKVIAPVVETPPEQKPTEQTPAEQQPTTEQKPAEQTPTEQKPAEQQPVTEPKQEEVKKSTEARLKKLAINPNDFMGFKKDTYEYSVNVPYEVTSVVVSAEAVDSKAKIKGTGKVTINEGNNRIGVTVTAEDGKTTKTYILKIYRKTSEEVEKENSEARLQSLNIEPKEYDIAAFESEKMKYSVQVPNEVTELDITAVAIDPRAQITGSGIIQLEEGLNELKIDVISVNGTKKTYSLDVLRAEAEKKINAELSTLTITGVKLSPLFRLGLYEYSANIDSDITSLDITTKTNKENAVVEILGNENLKQGENTITILVKDTENDNIATYQITVNKNAQIAEQVKTKNWMNPATWGREEFVKISIIIILVILLICAILLKINISKNGNEEQKTTLPGAEELDKALLEHQELIDEDNLQNKMDDVYTSDTEERMNRKGRGKHY